MVTPFAQARKKVLSAQALASRDGRHTFLDAVFVEGQGLTDSLQVGGAVSDLAMPNIRIRTCAKIRKYLPLPAL